MKTSLFALSTLVAGLSLAASASAQTTASAITNPGFITPTAGTVINERTIYCPTSIEPILPNDYYACEARAAYGREQYRQTISMLEEAAYWANKDAQYVLGLAYSNGDMQGVPQNRPLGLAWFALAAERKNQQYVLAYAQARVKATPQELSQAQALWKEMRLKYSDNMAVPRVKRRFDNNIRDIDKSAHQNDTVYLRGFSPYPESAVVVADKLHDEAAADFENVHAKVKVGEDEWLQAKPAGATQNTAPSTGSASSNTGSAQP